MSGLEKQILTCVIIDDERPAHAVLEHHIANTPWVHSLGNLYNAVDALSMLPQMKPDIIFLDVNMPNLSGLQLLDIVKLTKTAVILTSAYAEYALDGYHYDVTSFLLKPITFERFLGAVNKVVHAEEFRDKILVASAIPSKIPAVNEENTDDTASLANFFNDNEVSSPHCNKEALWIRVDKRSLRIRYEDISFIESEKNYVRVHYSGVVQMTRGTLNYLEENLPSEKFVRTHRSYIVNRQAIKEIQGNMIIMADDFRVSISPSERLSVFKLLRH